MNYLFVLLHSLSLLVKVSHKIYGLWMVFEFQDLNKPMDCLIMRIKKKKSNSNTKVDTELKRFQRKKNRKEEAKKNKSKKKKWSEEQKSRG